MKDWNDFAESLSAETKLEMAQNFFGKRRQAEDEMNILTAKTKELKTILDRVGRQLNLLHTLLLDESHVKSFYADLGIEDSTPLLETAKSCEMRVLRTLPHGLTFCRRYAGFLLDNYTQAQEHIDEYLHGRWVFSSDTPGKKKLTVNYEELEAWCAKLNEFICDLNKYQSPSQVLEFVKRMDPTAMDRERLMGGTMDDYVQSLDADLKLPCLEWKSFSLKKLPDLPKPDKHAEQIKSFGKDLCNAQKEKARQAINRLQAE